MQPAPRGQGNRVAVWMLDHRLLQPGQGPLIELADHRHPFGFAAHAAGGPLSDRTVSLTSGLARDSYEAVTDSPRPGWPPCCGYRRCCELRGRAAAQMSQRSRRMLSNPDPPGRIMVVDDDATIVDVVRRYLIRDGHEVECVPDGAAALRLVEQEPPDLVVLDLMLPGIGGLEVCRRLREHWLIPVVMLTALGEETDRVVGFETGADDYVTKPFSPRELALRVRSVLRRARGTGLPDKLDLGVITDGDLVVDLSAHEVRANGKLIQLTSREYDLLVFLMRNPRKAFTREQLLTEVWSWTFGDTSTVTVHVRRLREKLEPDPTMPRRIVTVWGVGYRYEPEAA